ncbi:MAG: MFS transporter [Acidimicrobiales bacterium]
MPTLRTVLHDPAEIERRSQPRDDHFVQEESAGDGRFVAVAGPFARWERQVETEDGVVRETLRYAIDAPHWGPLVDQLLRRPIRHGVASERRPLWAASDRLSRHDATIMGLCATLSLISGFLGALIGQTIKAITEDLGGGTDTQARALAIIRIGAVLTFAATALADRRGRRPLMRACLVGAALACVVTALAPSIEVVTVSQLVARGLVAGAAFLIPIICAEELPAGSRAYAIGLMSLPGGLGAGMVLWCLPILDLGRSAWRALFLLAIVALAATLRTVRRLPETRRFVHDDHVPAEHEHQHIRVPRLALLAAGMFLLNLFVAPTQQLQTDYLRHTRGMDYTAIAAFLLLTNTWGFIGIIGGAQLADRVSRRAAATLGVAGLAVGNTLMFRFGGAPMWAASLFGSVVGGAVIPSLGALLPELFPTLRRGAANGLLNGAAVLGSISGLLLVGHFVSGGRYGPTITALAAGPLLVAVLVWWLPETAGVELETLNPDD